MEVGSQRLDGVGNLSSRLLYSGRNAPTVGKLSDAVHDGILFEECITRDLATRVFI